MKKFYITLLCGILFYTGANAQDIHFSQYWASPLTLNPALTGEINGVFRAAVNYRTQWYTIPTLNSTAPYQTYQASYDMPLFREKLGNDGFGVGGTFYADKAGDGSLSTYSGMASIAYHKAIDRYGRCRLSLGLQAGVVSKQININSLVFENQFDPSGGFFNRNTSNGETFFNNKAMIYPDVNIGGLWTQAVSMKFHYYLGFAMDHLSRPVETFYQNEAGNRLNYRYNFHAGGEIFMNRDNTFSLDPTFLFMLQGNALEFNPGLLLNYEINDDVSIFGGGWYRVSDAVILNAGAEYKGFRLGLSYDINYSDLKTATHAQGGLEVSLVYIFKKEKPGKFSYEKYCPLF